MCRYFRVSQLSIYEKKNFCHLHLPAEVMKDDKLNLKRGTQSLEG